MKPLFKGDIITRKSPKKDMIWADELLGVYETTYINEETFTLFYRPIKNWVKCLFYRNIK
jgi:hypothetical protein